MVKPKAKTCKKCRTTKDVHLFYENKKNADLVHSWCIACCREYAKTYYKDKKGKKGEQEPKPELPPGHKRCPRCEETLPLEAFSTSLSGKFGRQSWCKACYRRKYVEKYHPEGETEPEFGLTDEPTPTLTEKDLVPY